MLKCFPWKHDKILGKPGPQVEMLNVKNKIQKLIHFTLGLILAYGCIQKCVKVKTINEIKWTNCESIILCRTLPPVFM